MFTLAFIIGSIIFWHAVDATVCTQPQPHVTPRVVQLETISLSVVPNSLQALRLSFAFTRFVIAFLTTCWFEDIYL